MTKACTCRAGYRRVPDSTSPGLPHDGFPYLGALRYAADVERVEHEAGCLDPLVVTAHAVPVEQRTGIGRGNGRGGRPGPPGRQHDQSAQRQEASARHVHTSRATPIFDEMIRPRGPQAPAPTGLTRTIRLTFGEPTPRGHTASGCPSQAAKITRVPKSHSNLIGRSPFGEDSAAGPRPHCVA